jgi:hypothetical protein
LANLSADDRDKLSPVWDMSQERLLVVTLVNQRFQFFMVIFSLVIGCAANAKNHVLQSFMLVFGALIATLLAIALYQVHVRHRVILRILREDPTHPYTISWSKSPRMLRAKDIVAVVIPVICCVTLLIGATLSLLNIL